MKSRPRPRSPWISQYPTSPDPLRFALFSSRPHAAVMYASLGFVIAGSALGASISYVFKLLVSAIASLPAHAAYVALAWAAGYYIAVRFLMEMCFRASGFSMSRWAVGMRATSRAALTGYLTLHSRAYFSDRFAGALSNKVSHAASGTRDLVDEMVYQFLQFFITALTSLYLAFLASPLIAAVFAAWIAVAIVSNFRVSKKRARLSAESQKLETALNGVTVDLISNVAAMQEYARRSFEIDRIKDLILKRNRASLLNSDFGERWLVFNNFIQTAFTGAMVYLAVHLAATGAVAAGNVVLVVTIIFSIEGQILFIGTHLNSFAERWGEVKESLEEILEPHEIPDRQGAKPLLVSKGAVDFEGVSFSYANNDVIKRFSLQVRPGERVGLVGRSGAGKSTLLRLALHHHDVQSGSISIDGQNIAGVTQESLRESISIVPQEAVLFHRSARENIAYGRPEASDEEIVEAAKMAQAHDFIMRLDGGYESIVGDRGVKLSGGERQRIAIARAILKNAPILLLDEATSALDSESEILIQRALDSLMEGKSVIAIAHRLSTLREMDRIVVMKDGSISEEGPHDELVQKGGIYADLWSHQAGGFIKDR